MDLKLKGGERSWARYEELIYSFFCMGIAASLVFWPLLNSMFGIGLFGFWLIFTKKKFSIQTARSRWLVLFGAFYAVTVLGALYSQNIAEARSNLQLKSAILLFPLVFATSNVITPAVFKRTTAAFYWATFFGCLWCISHGLYVYFTTGSGSYLQGYKMVLLKNMQPFMFGLCCVLSIIFVINKLYQRYLKGIPLRNSYAELLIMAMLFLFVFLLGNRSMVICMTAITVYYCYHFFTRMLHRLIVLGVFSFFLVLAIIFNPYLNSQWRDLVDFSEDNAIQLDADESLGRSWGGKTIRVSIWNCSWDIISRNAVYGVGTGDVQDELQKAYERRKFYFASRYNTYNAHNQYIQETLGHGLLGLMVFVACIVGPLSVTIEKHLPSAYVLFLLCFAFICLTESLLEINHGVIWYSFFNAIFIFRKS